GVVAQWVPFYESTFDVVKSQIATFATVFPRAVIFSNQGEGWNTEVVLFGEANPRPIEPDEIQRRLDRPEYSRVRESLAEVNFLLAVDLMPRYAGGASDLKDCFSDAQINTDRNLRLQYLAGMGSTANLAAEIYGEMMQARRFPEDLFDASEGTKNLLREALAPQEPPN